MDKIKFLKLKNWVKANQLEFILLIVVLAVGAFVRLYKINEYMTFLGDEGRDVIIVRRLLIEHHPPLIGPGTSIGNMYLGPAYYYMIALPLLFFNFSPVGPAVFIALLGVVTIWFLWRVVFEWFPTKGINWGALIASFLYAISPVIIIYSKSSWNPNIMPFFSLLTVYAMWRVWTRKQFRWLIVAGLSFACVLQSHYLGLLLVPVILVIWFLTFLKSVNKKRLFFFSFISFGLFLLLMSPLAIFDIRHNFINFNAIKAFFTNRETTVSVLPWKAIPGMWPLLNMVTSDLVGAKNMAIGLVVALLISISFLFTYFLKRGKYDFKKMSVILVLTMWVGFALAGMALYKQHIYDHYFGFIFAAPFILVGAILQHILQRVKRIGLFIIVILVGILIFFDIQNSPLRYAPNRQLERAQFVSKRVEEIAGNGRFNFTIIAENNYDSAYRYFLNLDNAKVVDIDPQNTKDTITDQLIIVCEKEKTKCDPTHNPKAEVAQWGWSKVVAEYDDVFGVTIYKLGHTK